jgi:Ca2+-binding RTX toxin-like protein
MTLRRGARPGDLFEVFDPVDRLVAAGLGGDDTVRSHVEAFALPGQAGALVLAADAGAATGAGNDAANRLVGNASDNLLFARAGNDSIAGGAGDDRLFGQDGDDSLLGGLGADWAVGGAGADSLQGGQGADTLHGEAGDDLLHGGAGRDWLVGGAGNDLYLIDDVGDAVVEQAGGGSDTIAVALPGSGWVLAAEVEAMLLLEGTRFGVGNALDNAILGNAADNLLLGRAGRDALRGAGGQDSLHGDEGADTLFGGDGEDALVGGIDGDALHGEAGQDTLWGESGNDSLSGGEGADWLVGGEGNDAILGDAGADALHGDAGADTLEGGLDADSLIGGDGHDLLRGGDGVDWLVGGAGVDTLDGGAGAEWLLGGEDGDLYRVDDTYDVVRDTGLAGHDRVELDIPDGGYWLPRGAGIEEVVLLGTTRFAVGDAAANLIHGNGGANLLVGGEGADTLRGGDGNDTLYGGAGADRFHFGVAEPYGGVVIDRGNDVLGDYDTADMLAVAGVSVVATWLAANAVRMTFRIGEAWQPDSVLLWGDFSDPAALHLGGIHVAQGSLLIDTRALPGFVAEGSLYARDGVYLTGAAAGGGVVELLPPDRSGQGGYGVTLTHMVIPWSGFGQPAMDADAILARLATLTDADGTGALDLAAPGGALDQPFA